MLRKILSALPIQKIFKSTYLNTHNEGNDICPLEFFDHVQNQNNESLHVSRADSFRKSTTDTKLTKKKKFLHRTFKQTANSTQSELST